MVLMILALPMVLVLLDYALNINTEADESITPKEIVISNISDTGATISWVTEVETTGYVNYGTAADTLNLIASDIRDLSKSAPEKYKTHIVEIKNLSPSTNYFFEVKSDGQSLVEGANFKTDAINESVPLPKTLKGKVNVEEPYLLVYFFAGNNRTVSEIRSTYTANNGTFTYDISNIQTADGSSAYPMEGAKFVTYVNGLENGKVRVFHDTDADPGSLTLDTTADISFDTTVTIPSDSAPSTPSTPTTPTTPSTPTTPTSQEPGISLMNNMFADSDALTDPTLPTNVFVSNVSETSFQVNWITKEPTTGHVLYGKTSLEKRAMDQRDSNPDVKRYTHSVTVQDSAMTAGQQILFKISSNNKYYGVNNGTSAYKFIAPAILDSPPTPQAILGELDYLSGSVLSNQKRDYIIYGKVSDQQSTSSIFVSTVPAFNSNGWSLSIGGARNADLSKAISSPSSVELYVIGEFNSRAQKSITISEDPIEVSIQPGLSVINIGHDEVYPSLDKISGTANASSNINLQIGSFSTSATSDAAGNWTINLSDLSRGKYVLSSSSSGEVLGLSFQINLAGLPETAFGLSSSTIYLIIGFALLTFGIYLKVSIKRQQI